MTFQTEIAVQTVLTAYASDLKTALTQCKMALDSRCTVPMLANVHFARGESLVLTATNLDKQIEVTLPDATCTESFTVSLVQLLKFVTGIDGLVTVTMPTFEKAVFTIGDESAGMFTLPEHDFPFMPSMGETYAEINLPMKEIHAAFDFLNLSIYTDETRYYLKGIAFDFYRKSTLTMVATDGHKMAMVETNLEFDAPDSEQNAAIFPSESVKAAMAIMKTQKLRGDVLIEFDSIRVKLTSGNTVLTSKLIDGDFPDWTRVQPNISGCGHFVADCKKLAKAAKRIESLSNCRVTAVTVDAANGTIGAIFDDSGDVSIRAFEPQESTCEPYGVKAIYLEKIVAGLGKFSGEIDIFGHAGNPGLYRATVESGDFNAITGISAVIMPMRT